MSRTLAFALLLSAVPFAAAQDSARFVPHLEIGGYAKYLHSATWVNAIDQLTASDLVHHRLNLRADVARHTTLRIGMRDRFFHGEAIKLTPGFGDQVDSDTGQVRMSIRWVDRPGALLLTTFDRAVVQYARDRWELHIGRQRINWGITNVWNPNDLFNAFNFLDFDYEERPGSDAVRLLVHPATDRTVEAAFAWGAHADDHVGAMLYRFNRWTYDVQVLAGLYKTDVVLGGGWAGHIADAGFKGEAAWFAAKDAPLDSTGIFTASVMFDRTYGDDWYVSATYLFNSFGDAGTALSSPLVGRTLSAKRLFPFEHTFSVLVNRSFSPITAVNMYVIYSPYHNSVVLFPAFTWNVASGFDLDLTAQSFLSESGPQWRSLGNAAYLRLRWSY